VVLGEEVGLRRISACGVGFIGTLMVIQPSFAEVGWVATLPLSVAVIFAVFMLITRQIAKEADPLALQAVGGLVGVPILLVLLLLPIDLPDLTPGWPSGGDAWLLVAMGVLGTVAHLLMTWSLRFAPSATLAPMQYLEIPVATLLGLLFFDELPDGLAAAGIALTVGAGLYIIWRERVTSRAGAA
jgi:drug/metabolite transporter (DMT)-like permease